MPRTKISRGALLAAAWELFHRRGFAATSLADLSRATGLGKAGLLHHFGSKAGLVEAVIAWAREAFRGYVLSAFAKTGSDAQGRPWTPERRLGEALRRQFHLAQRDGAGCFFANSMLEVGADAPYAEQLRGFVDDWLGAVAGMLAERYPRAEAEERAYRLFTDYQGSVMLFKVSTDESHLRRFRERAVASLAHPLAPAGPQTVPA